MHEPLSPDEAAMAHRLRSLPLGEPSAKVDATLLAASRTVQKARPRPLWIAGFAAAASLVLVIGLVSRLPTNMQPSATPPLPAAREDAPSEPAVDTMRDQAAQKVESRQISAPAASPSTPAQGVASDEPSGAAQSAAVQSSAHSPVSESLNKITVSGSRLTDGTTAHPAPKSSEANAALGTSAAARAESESESESVERAEPPIPARAARATTKGEAPPAPVVCDSATPMAIEAPPPVVRHAQDELPEPASAVGNVSATAATSGVPCDELTAIRELLRAEGRDAATARLRALMQDHPDWKVPDDLRSLLE